MNFSYDKTTDSLYIALSSNPSSESEEVADGIVVDYDAAGHIVGLDIENASKHINLQNIQFDGFLPKVDVHPA